MKARDAVVRIVSGPGVMQYDTDRIDVYLLNTATGLLWVDTALFLDVIDLRLERVNLFANVWYGQNDPVMHWSYWQHRHTTASRLDFHNMGFYFLHSTMMGWTLLSKRMSPQIRRGWRHIYTRQLAVFIISDFLIVIIRKYKESVLISINQY